MYFDVSVVEAAVAAGFVESGRDCLVGVVAAAELCRRDLAVETEAGLPAAEGAKPVQVVYQKD